MFIVPQEHVGCALVSNILIGKLGVIDQHSGSNDGENILRNETFSLQLSQTRNAPKNW
jgi:hypothetical protein